MEITDLLALAALLFWPLVPLFWIPVHLFSGFFRRLGVFTYITPFITWLPFAAVVYLYRAFVLGFRIEFPLPVRVLGAMVLAAGLALQILTFRMLRIWGIMGLPEVTNLVKGRVLSTGPYAVVRHPTYLSHSIMFSGIYLITGVHAVAGATLLDILIITTLVIPLEDRELVARFGDEYRIYREKVPAFFPRFRKR